MLMLAGDVEHLIDLCRSDFPRIRAAHPHSFAMHLQHYLRRLFATHREYSLQHHDDKVHWGVVVVEQDNLIQGRGLEACLFGLENAAVLVLNRHAMPETRRPML